tara:strand:- start:557 stop:964 length:408 start_codon:yes stop_codon:yes gene_type:complete
MRSDLVTKLKALSSSTIGTFTITDELPWTSDNTPLYIKNLKRIYIDRTQSDLDPILDTLDGQGIATEISTTTIYYACDAKQLPSNYDTLTSAIKDIRLDFGDNNWTQRRVTATSEYESDRLVQSLEFVAERVVNN